MSLNAAALTSYAQRMSPLLLRCIIYASIIATPMVIAWHYRFLPGSDCLRHVAKAVSGRSWDEIILLRPGVVLDQHPGWHSILAFIHKTTHAEKIQLVVFSYVSLFLFAALAPIARFARPEAWVAGLVLASVGIQNHFAYRLTRGRPYILTMGCLLVILQLWTPRGRVSKNAVIWTILLVACSVWIHGSWYLWALPACAFCLSSFRHKGLPFAASVCLGVALGSIMTGHPILFPWQQVQHALLAFGHGTSAGVLVGEFNPSDISAEYLIILALLGIIHKMVTGRWVREDIEPSLLLLGGLGWLLGLAVYRWWGEWGVPAMILWSSLQIESLLASRSEERAFLRRFGLTCFLGLAFFFSIASDTNGRWSMTEGVATAAGVPIHSIPGHESDDVVSEWLPESGGILYSADMGVFFLLFFENPLGPWRYAYGFESGLMPPEDLAILRGIQRNGRDWQTFAPWVKKMTSRDRLGVMGETEEPGIPGLEWKEILPALWMGRLAK